MTSPRALLFYESLLLGNQLLNRLHDLGYRATAVSDLNRLAETVTQEKALVLVVELGAMSERVFAVVRALRASPSSAHVPVLAVFKSTGKRADRKLTEVAQAAGITLVASNTGFLGQLPNLLEQILDLK